MNYSVTQTSSGRQQCLDDDFLHIIIKSADAELDSKKLPAGESCNSGMLFGMYTNKPICLVCSGAQVTSIIILKVQ